MVLQDLLELKISKKSVWEVELLSADLKGAKHQPVVMFSTSIVR